MSLKKSYKKICVQDAFHLENNETVTFKISSRPHSQDEYVLIFAGLIMRILSLFRIIPK